MEQAEEKKDAEENKDDSKIALKEPTSELNKYTVFAHMQYHKYKIALYYSLLREHKRKLKELKLKREELKLYKRYDKRNYKET